MNYNRGELAIGARILFVRDGKVLLGLRQGTKYASGKWMLPGGVTDRHETVLQSAIREAMEEVGIVARPDQLDFLGVVHWYKEDTDTDGIMCNWVCYEWSYEEPGMCEPKNKEVEKCKSLGWFDGEEIESMAGENLLESTTYCFLKEFISGRKKIYIDRDWPSK